ncbi:MAG: PadR family transcriptional regulator [Bacteroidetes bacterium CG2_30_33_31]|nr:MAG: PadR family transcriptional regulator [Bacteroidetes bacterium CG2_30_33_31]
MNIEKTKAQMRKGLLELCILSIINEKEAYASDIISKMKDSELIVVEGTLYPILTRLKNDGMLDYRWEESITGPPRKYYQLTQRGIATAKELKISWEELVISIEKITKQ